MKLVLATPLYPPDIAAPASYSKELAEQLSKEAEVTVVTYGRFVEPVAGVRMVTVDKRHRLPVRLARYTRALYREARRADVLYTENGPSVELPALIVSFLTDTRIVFHLGDPLARERASGSTHLRGLERGLRRRAASVIEDSPLTRPEIIPFQPRPESGERAYAASWQTHLEEVRASIRYD